MAVEPLPDEVGTPSFKVTTVPPWVETWDYDTFDPPAVEYIECLGEDAGWFGKVDFHYRSKTTPSGNEMLHCKADYATDTPLSFVGQTSDEAWDLVKGEDNCGSVTKANGEYNYHWQLSEQYVNRDDNKRKVHLRAKYQLQIDADGNVKVERFDGWCPGKP